ncbi:MAG: LacI family transcriptional regulator [Paracoccaceae bacterium]
MTTTKPRPTLKTIAQLSGLAVPTVSRALNDAPDIGEATKKRVRQIAREIGYRPDRAGLRLRTGKTNVIALVLSTQHEVVNFTARLITSIAAATRGSPYHMIVTPYFPDEDPVDPVRYLFETRSADGIILNQTQPDDPRVAFLMQNRFPFATHGRTNWADKHAYYDFDNASYGALCVRRLMERGRKNILMVAPPQHEFYAIEMIAGARAEAAQHGLTFALAEATTSYDSAADIMSAVRAANAGPTRPDGIIAASADAAMAITAAVESDGHRLGEDVDVIAKEASNILQAFRENMLIVPEDVREAGKFLGKAVMQAIDHPDLPPMQRLDDPAA